MLLKNGLLPFQVEKTIHSFFNVYCYTEQRHYGNVGPKDKGNVGVTE